MTQAAVNERIVSAVFMAMELSKKTWLIRLSDGVEASNYQVPALDMEKLQQRVDLFRRRRKVPAEVPLVVCYEAGRDGFSISRTLRQSGAECLVIDSASIEVPRRGKQAKTDRLDVKRLCTLLQRYWLGEEDALRVVREPSVEDEDARELSRERDDLTKKINATRAGIRGLLVKHGIEPETKDLADAAKERLAALSTLDGRELGAVLRTRLERSFEHLQFLEDQRRTVEAERAALLKTPTSPRLEKVGRLMALKGVGVQSAWVLVHEFFWRDFNNRQEVGAAAGLAPTPFSSGSTNREQGIGKAGNSRVRTLMVELSWLWLRHQPDSALTKWFYERWGTGGRSKRIGIVALARKLLVGLWHFVEHGVVPEGAATKAA
jgi:transposase